MSKTAVLNVRIDPLIKAEVERLYAQFGITLTDAINIFLHQSLNEGGLPFELKIHTPNSQTLSAMKETEKMIKSGDKGYGNIDDTFKELGI